MLSSGELKEKLLLIAWVYSEPCELLKTAFYSYVNE